MGTSAIDRFLSRVREHDAGQTLDLSAKTGAGLNPDESARVVRLQAKTGLPEDVVRRNLDTIERDAAGVDFNADAYRKHSPIVAQWLAEDPNHFAAGREDLTRLSYLERQFKYIGQQFQAGLATSDLQNIGERAMLGKATPGDRARQAKLEAIAGKNDDFGITGFFEGIPGAVANQLPIFASTLAGKVQAATVGGLAGGGIGAAAGAGAALVAGQAGPQAAVPEEVVTVPGAAAAGFSRGAKRGAVAGWKYGAAIAAGRMEAALAYLDYEKVKDENGLPLDRTTMLGAAAITGVVNGLLESVGFESIAKTVPGLRALSRGGIAKMLKSPSVGGAIMHYAKSVGEAMATEGVTEYLQEITKNGFGELARMSEEGSLERSSVGDVLSRVFSDANLQAAKQAGIAGAQAGGGSAAGAGSISLAVDINRAKQAQRNAQAFTDIGNGVKDAALMKRLPEAMETLVNRFTKDGAAEFVYAPADTWITYWQSKGADPAEVAAAVGARTSFEEAQRTGGDIAIPTARYATAIAPTGHNAFFANELRTSPQEMNNREAQEFVKRLDAMDQEQTEAAAPAEQASQSIAENLTAQLVKAGFDEQTASTYATTHEAFFRTLGERLGRDPRELFQKYNLKVARNEGERSQAQQERAALERRVANIEAEIATGDYAPDEVAGLNAAIEKARARMDQLEPVINPPGVDVGGMAERKAVEKSGRYEGRVQDRDLTARTDANEFVYARTPAGSLRANLEKVSTEGLIDELMRLHDANAVENTAPTALDTDYGEKWVGVKPAAAKAIGRQTARGKSIDKINTELARRGVDVEAAMSDASFSATDFSFEQRKEDEARGRIRFGKDRQFNIDLLKKADLSTFLHETGHFFLEVLGDAASEADAPDSVKQDYATLLKWFGVENRDDIDVEHHEKFARGFERYLMEGKAPTSALRQAFARFRAWLVSVYRQVTNLQVDLSDDVRGVFDRMLAADAEIAAARHEQGMRPVFPDPAAVGMTPAQAEKYNADVEEARSAAEEALTAKLVTELRREQKAWYTKARAAVKADVEAEVNAEPVYLALAMLQKGTMPNGDALPEGVSPVKLSKAILVDTYGKEILKRLPKPHVYAAAGGLHPDVVAEMYGFESGQALIEAIANAERHERKITTLTDERMRAQYGDILTDGRLPVEAMRVIHNEKRAQVLQAELAWLAGNNLPALKGLIRKFTRRVAPLDAITLQAQRTIAEKKVREINPLLYQRAEAKAAKEAIDAVLRGDFEAAFEHKQRELLNHELYRAAVEARERVDTIVEKLQRFQKDSVRAKIGKAGGEYLAQIDGILDRFDLRRSISLREIEKRKLLVEFVNERREAGETIDVPREVLNEAYREHYKDVTFDTLTGIHDTIEALAHLAGLKNRLLASSREREFKAAVAELVAAIGAHHKLGVEPEAIAKGLKDRLLSGMKHVAAEHTKMEFFFDFLDGYKALGPVWEYLFKPFADAENVENEKLRLASDAMREIMGAYTRKERAAMFTDRITLPFLATQKVTGTVTKANLLMMALNQGNAYNKDALLAGTGWTQVQVDRALATLTAKDWAVVQAIWDHLESYWPEIAALEKALTGLEPEKVEATPVVGTPAGDLRGGYFPIVFDRERSTRQAGLEEGATVKELMGGNWARAMTRHGHTQERTNTGGKPLLLEFSAFTEHLSTVIHDLAYRRAVIDVYKLVENKEVAAAIEQAAGREMYLQLKPWLVGIAGDRSRHFTGKTERLLSHARAGATVVGLGLKVGSALLQTLGYTLTVNEIGPVYATKGLRATFGSPLKIAKTWAFVAERSAMMRDRLANYDRDVRDIGKSKPFGQSETSWFMLIGYMDRAVSLPTWLGAYQKAMDGKLEGVEKGDEKAAIAYADKVVRETQAAGAAKDLAGVQRGGEAWRLFTMFYSSMATLFQQFDRTRRQFVLDRNVPRLAASIMLVWFVPAILEEMIRGKGPDDDDDDAAWAKYLARKLVLYPMSTVVLLRDLANAVDRKFETGTTDFTGSPAGEFGQSVVGSVILASKPFTDDEVTRSDWKNLVQTIGYVTKLPTAQGWKTGEYLYEWMTGEQEPANPLEGIWRAAVTGKPRE